MLILRAALLLAMSLVCSGTQAKPQMVGSWLITDEADEFEDKRRVVALTPSGKFGFAVRCLSGDYSVAILRSGGYKARDMFLVKVRVNDGKIIELMATALSGGLLELEFDESLKRDLRNAAKIAVRVTGSDTEDVVFRVSKTGDALAPVYRACP